MYPLHNMKTKMLCRDSITTKHTKQVIFKNRNIFSRHNVICLVPHWITHIYIRNSPHPYRAVSRPLQSLDSQCQQQL